MCGIAGIYQIERAEFSTRDIVSSMVKILRRRGPNAQNTFLDEDDKLGLGHARLSILDLSEAGSQPMTSRCGRYVICYNGEIYNYRQLAAMVESHGLPLKGHSDTEAVLETISRDGLFPTLERLDGMFAFALWDRKKRQLSLCRDRFGEKPLYYGKAGSTFFFASSLQVLGAIPNWRNVVEINQDSLASLLAYKYIPAPHSIFKGVYKLEPGSCITLDVDRLGLDFPDVKSYWCLSESSPEYKTTGTDLLGRVEKMLSTSVEERMISDVPIGAFLSGGIDSSLIVALMQRQSSTPVKTFTIGFDVDGYSEQQHAAAVAAHLGTEHYEKIFTPRDALDLVPKLPEMYDEPFSDSSQLATALVSRFAKEHVTVALSGDGGDEVFAGYNRYRWLPRIMSGIEKFPHPIRGVVGGVSRGIGIHNLANLYKRSSRLLGRKEYSLSDEKLEKMLRVLVARDRFEGFRSVITDHQNVTDLCFGMTQNTQKPEYFDHEPFVQAMNHHDIENYLPSDILTKVDRASMYYSLETRVPFLDYQLVEFARSLPMSLKISQGRGKWILRELLKRHVPQKLYERPKAGFAVPVSQWLRGELRGWGESLLSDEKLQAHGMFNDTAVKRMWREHQSGRGSWHHVLWSVLCFQQWYEQMLTWGNKQ